MKSHSTLTVIVNASEETIEIEDPAGANTFMQGFLAGLPEFMGLPMQGCCTNRIPCPSTDP